MYPKRIVATHHKGRGQDQRKVHELCGSLPRVAETGKHGDGRRANGLKSMSEVDGSLTTPC